MSDLYTCPVCHGAGTVPSHTAPGNAIPRQPRMCGECKGRGTLTFDQIRDYEDYCRKAADDREEVRRHDERTGAFFE